ISVPVRSIDMYLSLMKRNRIILDQAQRREAVRRLARGAAEKLGGTLIEDAELLTSVTNLLESPVVMTGHFDKAFLKLPKEVIVTALKTHQRYFSITDRRGRLMPYFVAFADGARRNTAEILKGCERVIQARLADAQFYYREDTAHPIDELAARLDRIVWLEGLGSLAQKSERMEKLALWIDRVCSGGSTGREALLRRAAYLAKADLASEMVKDGKEFTQLQGYIGREYARVGGEDDEVAAAIFEHYLPRFAGDEIPTTDTGGILSMADKLDTTVGCFLFGLEPTGSQDPYALRRQVLGFLRISIEGGFPVPLTGAVGESLSLFAGEKLVPEEVDVSSLSARIMEFITQRLSVMLRGAGFDYDLVAAVLSAPWEIPRDAREMVSVLQGMRDRGDLTPFVLAMKRITNIIPSSVKGRITRERSIDMLSAFAEKDEEALGFSSSLFREDAEKRLYDATSSICRELVDLQNHGPASKVFDRLLQLVPEINAYFDEVLVNCDDDTVRNNRISYLLSSYEAFSLYCNFSAIAGE
ncbi:MAG: glycine--tRNA ligase subunit beta, partial [bacterium]